MQEKHLAQNEISALHATLLVCTWWQETTREFLYFY